MAGAEAVAGCAGLPGARTATGCAGFTGATTAAGCCDLAADCGTAGGNTGVSRRYAVWTEGKGISSPTARLRPAGRSPPEMTGGANPCPASATVRSRPVVAAKARS